MARNKRAIPEINAGSMADIAFLLLIFFLVTTTMDKDKGLLVSLPRWTDAPPDDTKEIKARNTFIVLINSNDKLLVGRKGEESVKELNEIRELAKNFIDNNGDGSCEECQGSRSKWSSERPSKAVISLQNNRGTSYKTYVTVRNELIGAYSELRNDLANRKFGKDYKKLSEEQAKVVEGVYPQLISEAEPVSIGG